MVALRCMCSKKDLRLYQWYLKTSLDKTMDDINQSRFSKITLIFLSTNEQTSLDNLIPSLRILSIKEMNVPGCVCTEGNRWLAETVNKW